MPATEIEIMTEKLKNVRPESFKLETKDCVKGMSEMPEACVDIVVP